MIYQISLGIIVIYITYRILKFRAVRKQWKTLTDKFTPIGPHHPFWGALHLISSAEDYFDLTLKLVQETRTKIYAGWLMFLYPTFAVCHPDTVRTVLKSSAPKTKYTKGGVYRMVLPWLGDGLLVSSGRKWERNRRLLTPAFHFDILKPYLLEYNQVADTFLDNLQKCNTKDGFVEVYHLVSLATLDTMLRCSLSYESQIQETGMNHPYVSAVNRLSTLVVLRTISPWYFPDFIYNLSPPGREFNRLTKYVHDFADGIIKSRKDALRQDPGLLKKRRLDFLDILLTAKDENGEGLSDIDIRAEVDTFLFEGHDTTGSAISWAIYALGKYQEEQEIVFQEINKMLKDKTYMDWDDVHNAQKLTNFLKEVMRMYSTVPIIGRWLTEPIVLNGVEIPAHFIVDVNIYAMHHHPDVWPDHEKFRPERFEEESFLDRNPFCYTPFSAGSRNCIGQHFALNEQRVIIARLLKRFKVRLLPGHECGIRPDIVLRPKHGIKVILEDRQT